MAKTKLDYNQVARNIIANIGGKENVNAVRHCITRVRFRLKDESKANDETIKNLEGVVSVVHGGGEYMVVIGNAVGEVYDAVCEQLGSMGEDAGAEESKEKTNPVMKLLNIIVGAVGPCLNFICAGGIIKGLLSILEMTGIVQSGSGMDTLITAAGDAAFYFLPVFLGMNLAKTLKGDPFLGATIGAALCYPAINGTDLVILGMTFNYTYTSTFLPVIAVVAVAVPLARLLKKVLPKAVANFLVPAITLLIVIPLGYTLIGPAVSFVGSLANDGITFMMNTVPLLAGALFGGLYQVMVLFGIHSALTSFSFMNLLEGNPDYIMAIACTVSFAQTGVVLAMYLKTKDDDLKSLALPSFISGIFGVTEPAIYGVTLPRIKMFILSCVGGAVCGGFIMLTNTMMYSFSGLGVFAILGLLNPENPNVLTAVLCAVIPFVFSFAVAFVLYKDEAVPASAGESAPMEPTTVTAPSGPMQIDCPIPGEVLPLTSVPDETFSTGILGNGLAVEPSEGKVYAPFDGECETLADTLHAVGLLSNSGVSLLIHVGLETVGLEGKPFEAHVKTGDSIKKGQLLLEFDIEAIKAAGCPTITSVLVTNEDEVGDAVLTDGKILIGG
ncbi:MAG: glucose PTS transporter subunit IIA [Clostridiales bacterium]|nr:glucose PTS transporter subunit IIA [Clostridiales bacterium]